ncbi:hypothetical protein ATANTOWER_023155 [Ataeniobius toweri]|uniref:Uncharacterized protein n=1 Tax=Ataeniobius toweri TaxID=208326 RepID=A0ABU7A827_9TELE|nr:hypothetical protein [Ataeniobius toweri]
MSDHSSYAKRFQSFPAITLSFLSPHRFSMGFRLGPWLVGSLQNINSSQKKHTRTRIRRLPLYPGPGRGGSRLSRDAQTSLSPDTSSSSSGGSPRRSQASRET